MIAERIVLEMYQLYYIAVWKILVIQAFLNAISEIYIQIILIPLIVYRLRR